MSGGERRLAGSGDADQDDERVGWKGDENGPTAEVIGGRQ